MLHTYCADIDGVIVAVRQYKDRAAYNDRCCMFIYTQARVNTLLKSREMCFEY